MSLPPYKHSRNPAIETENDFRAYVPASIPLITHNGIVEKRKTTDVKLIRTEAPHTGVEFEYLPIFVSDDSAAAEPTKRNTSNPRVEQINQPFNEKYNEKPLTCCADDDKIPGKLSNENNETKIKVTISKNETSENSEQESSENATIIREKNPGSYKSSKCSIKKNRHSSLESRSSVASSSSRLSGKSASIKSSIASTIRNVYVRTRDDRPRIFDTTKFRRIANGLDENDQFPHHRRR